MPRYMERREQLYAGFINAKVSGSAHLKGEPLDITDTLIFDPKTFRTPTTIPRQRVRRRELRHRLTVIAATQKPKETSSSTSVIVKIGASLAVLTLVVACMCLPVVGPIAVFIGLGIAFVAVPLLTKLATMLYDKITNYLADSAEKNDEEPTPAKEQTSLEVKSNNNTKSMLKSLNYNSEDSKKVKIADDRNIKLINVVDNPVRISQATSPDIDANNQHNQSLHQSISL